ncbi:MAG: 2'-5' RNA ligase family protein [Chitinophagaceae bacterium]
MINQGSPFSPPLIFTLVLDERSTAFFNALRSTHFPQAINYLDAHLTLFHKLPAHQPQAMERSFELISGWPSFQLKTTGLRNLGRGVAYKLESSSLDDLRARLKLIWQPWLSSQDNQGFRAHITIQNKVEPKEARELLGQLSQDFQPFESAALGINTYEYLGGPWKYQSTISLTSG